jgi:tetrahydromethanopterin S-methyltransferase subunit A
MDFDQLKPGMTYEIGGVGFTKTPQKRIKFEKYPAEKLASWPKIKGSYLLGNPLSPIAVVIPMPDTDLVQEAVDAGAAIAGSMVTANHGIERVVGNIVANPNLRWIIMFGRESMGHKSGEALIKLVNNGVDENQRIVGATGMTPFLKNIPLELIERFRRQVRIINLLGHEDKSLLRAAVKAGIQEPENAIKVAGEIMYDMGRHPHEPLHFEFKSRIEGQGFYEGFGEDGLCLHAQTITQAWETIIDAILAHGRPARVDSDMEPVRELRNVMLVIHEPFKDRIPKGYQPEPWVTPDLLEEYLQKYSECLLSAQKLVVAWDGHKIVLQPADTSYTYGSRLRDYKGVDQIDRIIKAIKWCKTKGIESYRLYGVLEYPEKDMSEEPEKVRPPCFALFQVFPRKLDGDWSLDLFCYLRAWDFHRGAPANLYGFTEILRYLAEQSGCKTGKLIVQGGSVHIYGHEL